MFGDVEYTDQLDKKQCTRLLGIVLIIYTIIPSVPKMSITFNYVSWFCIIYLIGVLVSAVFAFIWFKNLKIGYSRVINTVTALTFGVNGKPCVPCQKQNSVR